MLEISKFVFWGTGIALVLFFFAESVGNYPKKMLWRSRLNNLAVLAVNSVVASFLSLSVVLFAANDFSGFGILGGATSPVKAVLAFVLFDFALYVWHRALHRYSRLWYFHQIHHSDIAINATTAVRLHIAEVIGTLAVKIIFVIIIGVQVELILAYEFIIAVASVFDHTNISFRGENTWAKIFIVPYLHRTHHSVIRSENDMNFGQVFSLWDRLFGTFLDKRAEQIGLPYGEQDFLQLLLPRKLK